ncbi:ABC transporter, permease protein [Marvinbryantia formatexigens DSM 14469]|uniref:ABC transporter, permease protein n=1 Tax=Marvinbryantia formatexigens DSM 14469 TaxID=478749 RepID=C6LB67_9FIRM|nr:carbohydrate ABC transporter permease [Marvinbryantia formatexigens]EET62198.1 ABC transporter, permease protein [Marvinbryantia formatexigens DSM 14469]UWO26468.1 carbohydrate ABC transporter permease [Marvinbryantia formatexigens DSM 14469]SDF79560.1 multiple sugar transport system permease protein [Marvinbryantia formatexigens]
MTAKTKKKIQKVIIYVLLLAGSVLCLMPLFWMIRSSLMTNVEIFMVPIHWLPEKIQWQNYKEVFTTLPFLTYYANSLKLVFFVVTGAVLTSSLCAYGLSRIDWAGRNIVFACIMGSMMLPTAVTIIPTFLMFRRIGITNSLLPLIIPAWLGGGAFYIFLLRQFFLSIPRDMDEAAYIDGATHFQIYSRIMLPLTKPALVVVGMFAFMNTWNDFLGPLIYLNSDDKYTVALGLQLFIGSYRAEWQLMMAAACLVVIPAVLVFMIGQRYLIEGITMTGVKG